MVAVEIVYLSPLTHGNAGAAVMVVFGDGSVRLGSDLCLGGVGDVVGSGEAEGVGLAFCAGVVQRISAGAAVEAVLDIEIAPVRVRAVPGDGDFEGTWGSGG